VDQAYNPKGNKMKRSKGFTIVQTMIILLIAGIVAWLVVNIIIDKRCESDPAKPICVDRKTASFMDTINRQATSL
jgi:competence protein ComGC